MTPMLALLAIVILVAILVRQAALARQLSSQLRWLQAHERRMIWTPEWSEK